MFDAPADVLPVWIGVAAVSVAVLGVATGLPTTPAPDAAGAAATIDRVATGTYPATGEHGLAADRLKLSTETVSLESAGGVARAPLAEPVTPAPTDERLERVLRGESPDHVFDRPSEFRRVAAAARESTPEWTHAPDRLRVRQVHWGGTRVTLVG